MEAEIRTFLSGISVEELEDRNVLQKHRTLTYLLRRDSVMPLLRLMEQRGINRLYYHDHNGREVWFLCDDGTFQNTTSPSLKSGNVADLEQPGNLFRGKNNLINPYFHRINGGR